MPLGFIGDVLGIGGSDSEAEANNDVDVSVTSSPIINIELDDFSSSIDGFSDEVATGFRSFASNLAFVSLIGITVLILRRGPP